MTSSLRHTLDFLLYQWLEAETLQQRSRFSDHSRETFDAVLDTSERIAREKYAPFNRLVDLEEPRTETEPDGTLRVVLPQATYEARRAYAESGLLSAAQDYDIGGMQLPYTVEAAANSFFAAASISIGSNLLTSGNANLLMVHGTDLQKQVFALNEFNGRWSGTMCLSEPQAGSSLSDVATRAVPDGEGFEADPLGPRYRLKGNKMWISSGDHELTENIVHLVLAKIPGPDGKLIPGVKGISLFIVPKKLVDTEGHLTGERNDVALAGLNHKLGWRGALQVPRLAAHANALAGALQQVGAATKAAWATGEPGDALANAVPYMQAFGHTVLAWVWLDLALATLAKDAAVAQPASVGRMGAMQFFFHYELPKIGAWLQVVSTRDATCAQMPEDAF